MSSLRAHRVPNCNPTQNKYHLTHMIRSNRGFAIIEMLLVALIILGLGYFYMKSRNEQAVEFTHKMKEAGIKMPADVKSKDLVDAVQKGLEGTNQQHDQQL